MKGGHVESYDDPLMEKPYDYGVNSYTEYGNAKAFFERFNVSISTPSRLALTSKFADFDTGVELEGYESPPNDAVTAALGKYLEICEKYENLIAPSYEKFPEKDIQAWRAQVGRFGLTGAHQTSPIKQLSDGLRNR